MIELYPHQHKAIDRLRPGAILCGGTGSGKSVVSIAYYIRKECEGDFKSSNSSYKKMKKPKQLYIITTARKRDKLEWEEECNHFSLDKNLITVDSWNNIQKYTNVKEDAFFIFDEQRLVGSGAWVKAFYKIAKKHNWIMLSATPGDRWSDYVPVFIANGFYKNKTDFERQHVIFKPYVPYKAVDRYVATGKLIRLRNQILINMYFMKDTKQHHKYLYSRYDTDLFKKVYKDRWNVYKDKPIKDSSELFITMRKIVNSDPGRIEIIKQLLNKHPKVIIFYNFNYELDILLELGKEVGIKTAQLNGHKHEDIPKTKTWMYLVQYAAGSEAWNCIETDTIIFHSQNYSYRATVQAAGRIDRLNTPYRDLYYYHILSDSVIDKAIAHALKRKETFNEKRFLEAF